MKDYMAFIDELYIKKQQTLSPGGSKRIEQQHRKGKQTARERIAQLSDENSFCENQAMVTNRSHDFGLEKQRLLGDGVVTGTITIGGELVAIAAQDFTTLGGSLGEMHAKKIVAMQKIALDNRIPFIQINDSGGARIQEGVMALSGYGSIFRQNIQASGVIPQISIIMGPCAGGAAYSPALTDLTFMIDKSSYMFVTGPDVVKTVTGEIIDADGLGGSQAHAATSGVVHGRFASEKECFAFVTKLLSYLPSNTEEKPPVSSQAESLEKTAVAKIIDIIPTEANQPYDVLEIIDLVFDADSFLPIHPEFAPNVSVGFAKLHGETVGIIANNAKEFAGVLDINSSDKAARFVRLCDSFNVPIISLVDIPGYLPGVQQEHGGVIRHGAKLLYAIAEATVPKISLIMRKGYGGGWIAMASKELGYDRVLAYPAAEIAVMGPEGAANVIFRKEIQDADDQDAKRQEKINEFKEKFGTPYQAAQMGLIDDIIDPRFTRQELYKSLQMFKSKQEVRPSKKHGNIPL